MLNFRTINMSKQFFSPAVETNNSNPDSKSIADLLSSPSSVGSSQATFSSVVNRQVTVEDDFSDEDSPRTPIAAEWQHSSVRASMHERRAERKQARASTPKVAPKPVVRDGDDEASKARAKRVAAAAAAAAVREAARVKAFRDSRDRVYESPAPSGPARNLHVEVEVVSPVDSLPPRSRKAMASRSDKPRKDRKKHEIKVERNNHPAPLPRVSKAEAAAATSPVKRVEAAEPAESKEVVFSKYEFKKLAFTGLWNNSIKASEYNHACHWGVHVDHGDTITVMIYPGLVENLAAYLATKVHDAKFANYTVAQAKALSLCRDPSWVMTPAQRLTSVMYAPALAYMIYWNDVQHISRVVTQSHFEFSWWMWFSLHASGFGGLASLYAYGGPSPSGPGSGVAKYPTLPRSGLYGVAVKFYEATRGVPRYVKSLFTYSGPDTPVSAKFNTEVASVPAKPRRECATCEQVEAGPFTRPDVPDAVRPRVEQVGPADSDYRPRVFENNLANQQAAVDARVLAATPEPDAEYLADYIKFVKNNADTLFGKACRIEPIPFDEYLRNSNASTAVKATLQRTWDRLQAEGIDASSDVGANVKAWTTRKAFTKEEFTNHRTPFGITEKAPRLIQGATPEFICLVGPWFAAFQGRLKKVWGAEAAITFASGLPADVLASKLNIEGRSVFDDDVSAFDASFVYDLLMLEVWMAKRYCAPTATLQLLTANCNVHGITSHGLKYSRDGCRCSGDPGTSCNNSWQNGCMHAFIYSRSRSRTCKETMSELNMLVAGDDNLGTHPSGFQVDWAAGMAKLGFKSTPHYPDKPHNAEFCSMRLTPIEGGWTLVPKVGRVINKIVWSLDRPTNVSRESMVRGTALSLWTQSEPCPPLRAFLGNLLRLTQGAVPYTPKWEPWKVTGGGGKPNAETWSQLSEIYDWSPEIQSDWEELLLTTTLDTDLKHPYLDLLLQADTDGPLTTNYQSSFDPKSEDTSYRPSCAAEAAEAARWSISGAERNRLAHAANGNIVAYSWSLSSEDRNRLAHALNGNTTSVEQSDRVLNTLADAVHMTPAATAWFKVATDIFHDTAVDGFCGVPDSVTGNSINPILKYSTTIGCPTGITSGTWDCHVVMLPFDAVDAQPLSFSGCQGVGRNNLIVPDTAAIPYRRVEPITILSYPSSDSTGYSDPFAAGNASNATHRTDYLELTSVLANGSYRVVSQGFEVINSTALINAQGMTTVYRSPVSTLGNATAVTQVYKEGDEAKSVGSANCLVIDRLPAGTTEALLLPGSKQWHASEGCYVMAHLNNCDSFPLESNWTQPLISRSNNVGPAIANSIYWAPEPFIESFGTSNVSAFRQIQWANMDIGGAFFTGLSPESTLTINWNIAIERFPSVLQPELVTLSSPSPEYCPIAFEMYKALTVNMPVGCMQKENGLGDWFRDAVATVAEVVSPVIAMVPHPAAQAISAGVSGIGKLAKRNDEDRKTLESVQAQIDRNNSSMLTSGEVAAVNRAADRAINRVERQIERPMPLPRARAAALPKAAAPKPGRGRRRK